MIDITMKRNPTGRMTTPQDVANAILALSGEGTDFINGDIIGVDGGEFITGLVGAIADERPGHRRRLGQRRPGRHGPSACRRPARRSSAGRSRGITAARAATRPWPRRGSGADGRLRRRGR